MYNDLQRPSIHRMEINERKRLDDYAKELEKEIDSICNIREYFFTNDMLPPQLHEWGGADSVIDSKVLKLRDSIATDLEFIKKCFNNPK